MKKLFKILGGLVAVVVLAVAGFVVFVQARGIPSYEVPRLPAPPAVAGTAAQVALGEKIVLATCADCHRNPETNTLAGQKLRDLTPDFGAVYSANITQDKTHGIGAWTDAELTTLLRTGIGRDGRYRVIMPSFALMSDEDLQGVLAFLRSDNALTRATPTPSHAQEPSFLLKALTNTVMKPTPLPTAAVATPAPTDALAYGRYLAVGRYKCYECHSKDFKSNNPLEPEKSEGYLGGGNKLLNLQGQEVVSRNLTADAETGLGDWTEAQFAQAIKFGMSPHGPLNYPMPKYSQLTDEEVKALYAYLQSVPKLRNATPEDKGAVAAR